MKDKLKAILEGVDPNQEYFTESVQNDLVTLFEAKLDEKNTEIQKLKESHEDSLVRLDEVHAKKMKKIVKETDEDHFNKMKEVLEHVDHVHYNKMKTVLEALDADRSEKLQMIESKIDQDHTAKLQNIINMYESSYKDTMIEDVSNYLDVYLEEVLPEDKAIDMAKVARYDVIFSEMRKLLVVTDQFVNSEIKEAVEDAKTQLDEKTDTINELMLEKVAMAKEIGRLEAKSLLGEKTQNMTDGEKAYITKFFEGACIEDINQRLDEAVRAYENDMTRKKEELLEEEEETDIPVIEESTEPEVILNEESVFNEEESMMDQFVSKINKSHQTR
jgi:hypothetical protein